MKIKCGYCKKRFIKKFKNTRYCSFVCFKKHLTIYMKYYRLKNAARIKKSYKLWYSKNKLYFRNWVKNHFLNYIKAQQKYKYFHQNIKKNSTPQKRKYFRNYNKNRRKIDIAFKIIGNLRSRLYKLLRFHYTSSHTLKLIGCSIEQLKQHLETHFQVGMSWKNYGKWHIDHIKPCCQFDLSKPKEQLKCFHYTNLQPLWAKDNLIKYKKYE